MGIRTGMSYAGVEAVMRIMGVDGREAFEGLQVIEREMVKVDEERREREQNRRGACGR
jgi:hypothetical protein